MRSRLISGESVLVRRSLAAGLIALAALAAPALARAGLVSMRVVPQDARSLQAAQPAHFDMLAAQWHGPARSLYRVHRRQRLVAVGPAPSDDPDWTGPAEPRPVPDDRQRVAPACIRASGRA